MKNAFHSTCCLGNYDSVRLWLSFTSHTAILPLLHYFQFVPVFYSRFAERELLIKKVPEILKLLDRVWKLPDEKS